MENNKVYWESVVVEDIPDDHLYGHFLDGWGVNIGILKTMFRAICMIRLDCIQQTLQSSFNPIIIRLCIYKMFFKHLNV